MVATATLEQRQSPNAVGSISLPDSAAPAPKGRTREEELFYAPANIARLERIFANMAAGNKVYHDLIEVDDDA